MDSNVLPCRFDRNFQRGDVTNSPVGIALNRPLVAGPAFDRFGKFSRMVVGLRTLPLFRVRRLQPFNRPAERHGLGYTPARLADCFPIVDPYIANDVRRLMRGG